MPALLKEQFNREFIEQLASEIRKLYPQFERELFMQRIFDEEWPQRELKQRMRHITITLHSFLPFSYARQIALLTEIAASFTSLPAIIFPDFVETYGLNQSEISLPALEYFTQFSSSEFAVRPFFEKDFDKMIQRHIKWAMNESPHVRRLASEGCRPRLPWAPAVKQLQQQPQQIMPILELLKDDESDYVLRSVGNNLNDISKDHPDLVLEIARKWMGKNTRTNRMLIDALRTLLKQGNPEALRICGVDQMSAVELASFELARKDLCIGDSLNFTFSIRNPSRQKTDYRLEYAVYYVKANGKLSKKVFQISKLKLEGNEQKRISRMQHMKDYTTRKHYPGQHFIALIVNGREIEKKPFLLERQA